MLSRPTNHSRSTSGVGLALVQVVAVFRTGWAWVARSRLGFIPGGDAPPLHDTTARQLIDWTFTPTSPPASAPHSVAAETVTIGDLGPPTQREQVTATIIDRGFIVERPARAPWLPWSVVLAAAGVGLVWLTMAASGLAGSAIGSFAGGSTLVCGLLLIVVQLIGGSKR